jgi:hypothetical protein
MTTQTEPAFIVQVHVAVLPAETAARWQAGPAPTIWLSNRLTRTEQLDALRAAFEGIDLSTAPDRKTPAEASTEASEQERKEIDSSSSGDGLGGDVRECADCGHEFNVAYSPEFERCAGCSEAGQ